MGLFGARPKDPQPRESQAKGGLPVSVIDFSKRYDVCTTDSPERLYENVLFIGIRTFEPADEYRISSLSNFVEVEGVDGTRWLIPNYHIRTISEHGVEPIYKVIRHRRSRND